MLSFSIKSEECKRLGIDNHVCELQLVLKEFAELQVLSLMSIMMI